MRGRVSGMDKVMKAYQCSKCAHLGDYDEYCQCNLGIDIRPGHREPGSDTLCKEHFKELPPEMRWHSKFRWEKGGPQ